ncbi:MAG: alpha/beta hydrolase [Clostridiales bacterium]|nr:alpha/beta hydrolase [Clostridiales bacterium]
MIHFGFSYIGLIFLVMLFVPNIIWSKNQPADYEKYVKNENKVLLALERFGEVTVSMCALIFSDLNVRFESIWSGWLILAFIFMILYELYWIRYFKSPKTMADMYSSYAGFPVAGASLPCLAFFSLGIYGVNIFLIVFSIILSIGHIGIHLMHRNEVVEKKKRKKAITVLKALVLIPIVLLLLLTITSIAGRNINCFRSCIGTSKGINEELYATIGGQKQYIQIRGSNTDNPVILYIHGGPAGPDSPISPLFTDPLIDDYTVVCWDQRGCGKTYFKNDDRENTTVTFDRALLDTDELVDYLCERFHKDKVILMCHSYGTVVGTRYVQAHSEKVSAYIGIGQFVNCIESDRIAYEKALEIATSEGKDTASLEKAYQEYQSGDSLTEYMTLRNATSKFLPKGDSTNTILRAFFSPYTSVNDVRWVLKQMDLDNYYELEKDLFQTIYYYDIYSYDLKYDVPMYFISGDLDFICNCDLARKFCEDIDAPEKEIVVVENGGHTPHYATPELVAKEVKRFLQKG